MPLLIHCDELRPGMRLAEAFLWRDRMMLPGGKTLTMDDIDILTRKYPEVTLKVGDPVLDSIAEFEDDAREREVARTAQQKVVQCMAQVQAKFSSHTNANSLNFQAIKNSVASILDYLKDHPVSAALLNQCTDPGNYLGEHAGNVFYLSLVLGSAVRDYVRCERMRQTSASRLSASVAMDLLPLGLGAMLCDIGMYAQQHVYEPDYELTDDDREAIHQHPITGAEALPDTLPAGVRMIVRAHHENYDGSGYPTGTLGREQHVFIRIVRICDAYEAATATRVYANAKTPCRALWEMCAGPYRGCYDPVLLKVFRSMIQPFPIGAKLHLADGRTAVVVRYNRREPFQPTVIVAFDEQGARLPAERLEPPVNLGEGNNLRIASYDGEALDCIYDIPPEIPERVERAIADQMSIAYP